jgi:hypothetical protein
MTYDTNNAGIKSDPNNMNVNMSSNNMSMNTMPPNMQPIMLHNNVSGMNPTMEGNGMAGGPGVGSFNNPGFIQNNMMPPMMNMYSPPPLLYVVTPQGQPLIVTPVGQPVLMDNFMGPNQNENDAS